VASSKVGFFPPPWNAGTVESADEGTL